MCPFYFRDEAEADRRRRRIKQERCPHCHCIGFLNCHGFLRGFEEGGNARRLRGFRFFCNNRGRRRGCGRTHSFLLGGVLRRRQLTAPRLWSFLFYALSGLSRLAAWRRAEAPFSLQHAYRIWRAVERRQGELCAALCRLADPPDSTRACALLQLVEHLHRAFAGGGCPIAAYQTHFQQGFLG
jgi:hypothetical protein